MRVLFPVGVGGGKEGVVEEGLGGEGGGGGDVGEKAGADTHFCLWGRRGVDKVGGLYDFMVGWWEVEKPDWECVVELSSHVYAGCLLRVPIVRCLGCKSPICLVGLLVCK